MNKNLCFALIGAAGLSLSLGVNAAQAQSTPVDNTLTIAQGMNRYGAIEASEKYSYIGVAGNLGLSDTDRGVADDGVAIISKMAILKNLSFRPGVIFAEDAVFTVPVTYDFNLRGSDPMVASPVTPYLGAGVSIDSGDEGQTDFLVTGGVDYRFAKHWVGNAGVNVGLASEETNISIMLGVGYAFPHQK